MNEEEKKAIEKSKLSLKIAKDSNLKNMFYDISNLENLLNLVDKQQQEIDTLKESQLVLYGADGNIVGCLKLGKDVVSKEEIREIINSYENEIDKDGILTKLNSYDLLRAVINRLEELLGE